MTFLERIPPAVRERAWWDWWREHGELHLNRILREDWNPIGETEVPADEYEPYATRLAGLLREGSSSVEIAAFLSDARAGALGLPGQPQVDEQVADTIHAWYLRALRAPAP